MKRLRICEEADKQKQFEIVVQLRDPDGNPLGKTKSYSTDSPAKLAFFWNNMKGRPRRKKRKKEKLPSGKEADKLMQQIGSEAEEKQKEK